MNAPLSERIWTVFFPHRCFLCRRETVPADRWVCEHCAPELPVTKGMLCPHCGKAADECTCGQRDSSGYDGAAVPLFYTDGVARGIHSFKYGGKRYYVRFLADLMAQSVRETFEDIRFDAITYVPLHPKKQRKRGYCQTLLLARELSAVLKIPVKGGLLRHTGKGGAQMEQKGRKARQENARLSFTVGRDADLQGKTYLLVDDVLTTGATADRCAGLLRRNGVSAVYLTAAATTRLRSGAGINND